MPEAPAGGRRRPAGSPETRRDMPEACRAPRAQEERHTRRRGDDACGRQGPMITRPVACIMEVQRRDDACGCQGPMITRPVACIMEVQKRASGPMVQCDCIMVVKFSSPMVQCECNAIVSWWSSSVVQWCNAIVSWWSSAGPMVQCDCINGAAGGAPGEERPHARRRVGTGVHQ